MLDIDHELEILKLEGYSKEEACLILKKMIKDRKCTEANNIPFDNDHRLSFMENNTYRR